MTHPLHALATDTAGRIAARLSDARVTVRMSGSHAMRDIIAEELRAYTLALLRHPAMREPSRGVSGAHYDACMRAFKHEGTTHDAWRAGCGALAREIEESGRG